ncbi:MAG: thermonuclease family protein, partial [Saprospiraceae bacterium]
YHDTLINYKLIEKGLAWHYKKYSSDPVLSNAEIEAKENKIGLWSDTSAIAPWDWRKGNFNQKMLTDSTGKVFICLSEDNTYYHLVHYCEMLNPCAATTILVFPKEAIEVYHKIKCLKCFQ